MERYKDKKITERENGTLRIQTVFKKKTRTQQQFAKDCNINNIIKKYKKTGVITHINTKTGVYADMTQMPNYQEALQTVIHGQTAFDQLPAELREKFKYNPQEMMDYLNDKRNDEEAIKLGLKQRPKKETTLEDVNSTLTKTMTELTKTKKPKTKVEDEE